MSKPPAPDQVAYQELQCYTLAHGDASFLHQHLVDAWMAQHADSTTKPIAITFALAGLHLHVDCGFTGRQVQRAHMVMGQRKRAWPSFVLPVDRGALDVHYVSAAAPGAERDAAIHEWCASVWDAYRQHRPVLASLLEEFHFASQRSGPWIDARER